MNRRDFLLRSLLASVLALPLIRTGLRRWVTLHRAGDPIPEYVMRTTPPLAGQFGVDALSLRTPSVTRLWPLRPIPSGRAICEWPTCENQRFDGAPTHWNSHPLIGDMGEGACILIGAPFPPPPHNFRLSA